MWVNECVEAECVSLVGLSFKLVLFVCSLYLSLLVVVVLIVIVVEKT